MSAPPPKYRMTMADLKGACALLAKIEVRGEIKSEQIVGLNSLGEIVVRVKGKVTPGNVIKFRNEYQRAKAAGIIKETKPSA